MALFTLPLYSMNFSLLNSKAKKSNVVNIDEYRGVVFLPRRSSHRPITLPGAFYQSTTEPSSAS